MPFIENRILKWEKCHCNRLKQCIFRSTKKFLAEIGPRQKGYIKVRINKKSYKNVGFMIETAI